MYSRRYKNVVLLQNEDGHHNMELSNTCLTSTQGSVNYVCSRSCVITGQPIEFQKLPYSNAIIFEVKNWAVIIESWNECLRFGVEDYMIWRWKFFKSRPEYRFWCTCRMGGQYPLPRLESDVCECSSMESSPWILLCLCLIGFCSPHVDTLRFRLRLALTKASDL